MSLSKLGLGLLLLGLAACNDKARNSAGNPTPPAAQNKPDSAPSTETAMPQILDAAALFDGTDGKDAVDPCEDFYQFACGNWLKNTEIPAERSSVSRQITALADASDVKLSKILESFAQGQNLGMAPAAGQLGDFYASCMDYEKSSAEAVQLIQAKADEIQKIATPTDLARQVARLHRLGVSAFFGYGSSQDMNDSTQVIGFLYQSGMALPEPDYYTKTDAKSLELRDKFVAHIEQIVGLAGLNLNLAGSTVLALETTLASTAYSHDDQADPLKTNHPYTRAELKKLAPNFEWDTYFSELGASDAPLNVMEPEFFTGFNTLLNTSDLAAIKTYLMWQLVDRAAPSAGADLSQASFDFWQKYLLGAKNPQPRWKVCTQKTEGRLGYALAEAYTSTLDTAPIQSKVETMINQIKDAFRADLELLTNGPDAWMDADTLKAALEKFSLLGQKVGAPKTWHDYSALKTDRSSFLANDLRVVEFEAVRDLAKIGQPVDHTEWGMMPWEINAYYDGSNNEFVFPFGILQPPSFDVNASDGANFGAFGGGTIGHELTHGYDNDGRNYDGHGNLKDWWSDVTTQRFNERAQCFIDQADAYSINTPEGPLNVHGKTTLPENLADQGGVKLGYLGLTEAQRGRAAAPLWIGRYTENQQYWIAYAQSWCSKRTTSSLRNVMQTDEHPPEEFRVNGVVMNRPEFARDFNCKPKARMAPTNRCSIW